MTRSVAGERHRSHAKPIVAEGPGNWPRMRSRFHLTKRATRPRARDARQPGRRLAAPHRGGIGSHEPLPCIFVPDDGHTPGPPLAETIRARTTKD